MNIFVTDPDPQKCAIALDDVRLRKMIVETAQLLSTALHEWGHERAADVYKPTHRNHPCNLWARENAGNFMWLYEHMNALAAEYQYRFEKEHKTAQLLMPFYMALWTMLSEANGVTPFPNCTPYKDWEDVTEAYKQTLRDKWANDKRPPKWTKRELPEWING